MVANNPIEQLNLFLVDEDYRKILTLCLEPKKRSEISDVTSQTKTFQIVNNLMKLKALQIVSGRYVTAQFVGDLL